MSFFSAHHEAFISLRKKIILLLAVLGSLHVHAQVSPYQIPPKWMFGLKSGLDFGTSPYTNSPPLFLPGNPSNILGMEASASACDPASNLVFYSDANRYFDYPANGTFTFPGALTPGSGSATDGAVAVPDPANPSTRYFLFTANDRTGGIPNPGINYYVFTKSGSSVTVTGPNNLTTGSAVDESLCAGSDGKGGYWIISHNYNNAQYMVWHVTTTGVAAAPSQTPPGSPVNGIGTNAASFKINRCQDRIAYATASHVQVYVWDRDNGTVGAELYHKSGIGNTIYGLEFSPNGRFVYYTELNGGLWQIDLNNPTGNPVSLAGSSSNSSCSEMGTMQLGPDNRIYVTTCGNATTSAVYLGVITTPDAGVGAAAGYQGTGFQLKANTGSGGAETPSISRGIVNMAWMSPQTPTISITAGSSCTEKVHTINFNTYFNTPISLASSPATYIQWSFDNGITWVNGNGTNTFTYDYGGSVTTTVRARFYDQVCSNYQWTASEPVTISCPMPVELIDFYGVVAGDDVILHWSTAMEFNNSHFVIQHSADGVYFSDLGIVAGQGSSKQIQQYSLTDYHPYNGVNYYRLVQYDVDGKMYYSGVISISLDRLLVNVYPNPSADDFNIYISGAESATLEIYDVLGRTLYSQAVQPSQPHIKIGKDFPQGTYIVKVVTLTESTAIKIVKE